MKQSFLLRLRLWFLFGVLFFQLAEAFKAVHRSAILNLPLRLFAAGVAPDRGFNRVLCEEWLHFFSFSTFLTSVHQFFNFFSQSSQSRSEISIAISRFISSGQSSSIRFAPRSMMALRSSVVMRSLPSLSGMVRFHFPFGAYLQRHRTSGCCLPYAQGSTR